MVRKAKKLFTIGYEQTPPKAVLDELEPAGVKLLVDVRALASSRRPGFSTRQLEAGCDARRQVRAVAQDLCRASQDATGERATRRTVRAGEEVRPGLHSLLRARSQP